MKKRWVMAFCGWLALGGADAQPAADILTAHSSSGQFQALAPRRPGLPVAIPQQTSFPGAFLLAPVPQVNPGSKLALDPSLLVMSCERIKESLLLTLGGRDQWRGRITLAINPGLPAGSKPGPGRRGRFARLELSLDPPFGHRTPAPASRHCQCASDGNGQPPRGRPIGRVPLWLVAGLSARLQAENLPALLLRPQSHIATNQINRAERGSLRDQLRGHPPLTFQELSWPEPEILAGGNYDLYAGCAQLFVDELLRLEDGPRCLEAMIDKLPQHLNWQTSFLEAYSRHFGRLLDVEKWWGLACVHFTGVDAASRFSPAESWHKLQQALDVPVEVHLRPDHLPAQAEITLQEVITNWDSASAAQALQRAVQDLLLLRPQITPELRPLLDRYLATLQDYLGYNRPDRPAGLGKSHPLQTAGLRLLACKDLNALDAQRAALRSRYVTAPVPDQRSARANPPAPSAPANP